MLTIMLRDTIRTSLLEHISQELALSIEEVEGRLFNLEEDLTRELDIIAKRQAEFGRLADAAIYRTIDNDRENRKVIGLALAEGMNELCSGEETIHNKHVVNRNGIESIEEVTSAMSKTTKLILNLDSCRESKGVNCIK